MTERDAEAVVDFTSCAMNSEEGAQACETLNYHFDCRRHGFDDGRSYYVLADVTGMKGIVGLHFYHWGPAENVWLAWFAVEPASRGLGLGKRLMEFIVDNARELGYAKLFVETYSTPEFTAARRFYASQGFARVVVVVAYLSNGGDMVVFLKEPTPHV